MASPFYMQTDTHSILTLAGERSISDRDETAVLLRALKPHHRKSVSEMVIDEFYTINVAVYTTPYKMAI